MNAFTLIEVLIGVLVISLLVFSLHRFIVANVTALNVSTDASADRLALTGLIKLVQTQLHDLPPKGQNLLVGQPHKFNNLASDEMTWICKPGPGLMTSAAPAGDYQVKLELKPVEKTSSELELGLRRRPVNGTDKDETWLPLLRPVTALEIRYFHPQLNTKVDRWNDPNTRPSLVYLSVQRRPGDTPYEAVLSLPGAALVQ